MQSQYRQRAGVDEHRKDIHLPRGLVVPMLTPLQPSGGIDYRATETLVEYLIREQVDGLFILGSTGEGDSLSLTTQYRFAKAVARITSGRVPLFLGALHSSTRLIIDFVNRCHNLDAFLAIVVGVPYYRMLRSKAEVLDHFLHVYRSTGKPVIVYNLPHPASCVLTPETSLTLAQTEGIVGFKDSSGTAECLRALAAHQVNRKGFGLYQGEPSLSLASLADGASGFIPGTANYIPWVFKELYEAFHAGEAEVAARCQNAILRFREFARVVTPFSSSGFHYSTFKAGLEVMGFGGGTPAPPFRALPDDSLVTLRPFFEEHGVLERARTILPRHRRGRQPAVPRITETMSAVLAEGHLGSEQKQESLRRRIGL